MRILQRYPETIDRELGWAESIGFNTVKTYLHHLSWQIDPAVLVSRYLPEGWHTL